MTTLLVVDDEPLIRSGLRGALSQYPDIDIVGEAEDGRQAIDAVRKLAPDVVLMDVRMPRLDGLEATRMLVEDETIDTAILVLTTFDSDDYVYRAMHLGARGFLLKRWPIERIARAIELAADGESVVFPDSLARVIAEHGPGHAAPGDSAARPSGGDRDTRGGPRTGPVTGRSVSHDAALTIGSVLTAREQEVLGLLARGHNNAEIGAELHVTVETVKSQVSSILMKLDVRDRTQAVIRAFESGFVTARMVDRH